MWAKCCKALEEGKQGATVKLSTVIELSIKFKNYDMQYNKLADAIDLGGWEEGTSHSNDQ